MISHQKKLAMITEEYDKACEKHHKFCDIMTRKSERYLARLEAYRKKHTKTRYKKTDVYSAEYILEEEVLEALHAYRQGDKTHCLQELAQCGAVILRMMDFVEGEK